MWRPDDWKNPYPDPDFGGEIACVCPSIEQIAFEAGADAMLEALCTDKNRLDCIDQYGVEPPKNVRGWLVFIPGEVKR